MSSTPLRGQAAGGYDFLLSSNNVLCRCWIKTVVITGGGKNLGALVSPNNGCLYCEWLRLNYRLARRLRRLSPSRVWTLWFITTPPGRLFAYQLSVLLINEQFQIRNWSYTEDGRIVRRQSCCFPGKSYHWSISWEVIFVSGSIDCLRLLMSFLVDSSQTQGCSWAVQVRYCHQYGR